jgi:hypothetical protein
MERRRGVRRLYRPSSEEGEASYVQRIYQNFILRARQTTSYAKSGGAGVWFGLVFHCAVFYGGGGHCALLERHGARYRVFGGHGGRDFTLSGFQKCLLGAGLAAPHQLAYRTLAELRKKTVDKLLILVLINIFIIRDIPFTEPLRVT